MTKSNQQSAELTDAARPTKRQVVAMTTVGINKLVITQTNALARSAHQMTQQEKRLLFLAMAHIRQNDNDFVCYHIPVTTIKKYLEINDKDLYCRLQSVTDKLLSRVVKIEKENGGWKKFQWVSYSEYIPREESNIGEACVEIQLHDHLKPLLLNLKKYFGSMHLRQIVSMSSVNSIRIFEILYYSSMRFAKTELYFSVENLKERLGMERKYANFRDFRKDVLHRAQRECEIHTLLVFTWEEEKKGRKIVSLRFQVKKNPKFKDEPLPLPKFNKLEPMPTATDFTAEQTEALSLLKENGVNETTAASLVKDFPPQRLVENVKLAREKHNGGKAKDLGAVTVAAIREDWSSKATYKPAEGSKKRQLQETANEHREKEKKQLEDLKTIFNEKRRDKVEAILASWENDRLRAEIEEYIATKNPEIQSLIRQWHEKYGLDSPFFKPAFRVYLSEKYLAKEEYDFVTWAQARVHEVEDGYAVRSFKSIAEELKDVALKIDDRY